MSAATTVHLWAPPLGLLAGVIIFVLPFGLYLPEEGTSCIPFCIYVLILFLISAAFYHFHLYPNYYTPLKHIPTPTERHWLYGNYTDIALPVKEVMVRKSAVLHKGDLVRIYLPLNIEVIFAVSPKAIREVFSDRSREFVVPKIMENMAEVLGIEGIITANGDAHKIRRGCFRKAYLPGNVRMHHPVFLQKAIQLASAMEKEQSQRGRVCIRDWAQRAALDVTCITQLDEDYELLRNDSVLKSVFDQFVACDSLTGIIMAFLSTTGLPRLIYEPAGLEKLRQFTRQALNVRRRKHAESTAESTHERPDIVSSMLESGAFSEKNMIDEVLTVLMASSETISITMQWAVSLLCKHPSIQERLRDEVRTNLPSPANIETHEDFLSRIEALPYLRAFCCEVLRQHPPFRFLARQSARDTHINGTPVPSGTVVVLSPEITNQNPELWGHDAATFNPDRWLGNRQSIPNGIDTHAFLTFGHGVRSCIGERFARMELLFFLAVIIGRFRVKFDDSRGCWEHGVITPQLKDGMMARLQRLDGW